MVPREIQKRIDALLADMTQEFPHFRLLRKADSKYMHFLAWVVRLWCPCFMTGFSTTSGYSIYIPDHLSEASLYEILRHERQHMRDYRKYWWFYPISYTLLFPAVLTFRALWEFRAFRETMTVEKELTGTIHPSTVTWLTDVFCSQGYLWMCPFRSFIHGKLQEMRQEILSSPTNLPI
jgi:hypothetical protein